MATARRRTSTTREPLRASPPRPRVTIADLEKVIERNQAEIGQLRGERAELRRWSSGAQRMMAMAALVLVLYAVVLYSTSTSRPRP